MCINRSNWKPNLARVGKYFSFPFPIFFFCQFIKTANKTLLVIRTINLRGQQHQLSFVNPGKYNVEQWQSWYLKQGMLHKNTQLFSCTKGCGKKTSCFHFPQPRPQLDLRPSSSINPSVPFVNDSLFGLIFSINLFSAGVDGIGGGWGSSVTVFRCMVIFANVSFLSFVAT